MIHTVWKKVPDNLYKYYANICCSKISSIFLIAVIPIIVFALNEWSRAGNITDTERTKFWHTTQGISYSACIFFYIHAQSRNAQKCVIFGKFRNSMCRKYYRCMCYVENLARTVSVISLAMQRSFMFNHPHKLCSIHVIQKWFRGKCGG